MASVRRRVGRGLGGGLLAVGALLACAGTAFAQNDAKAAPMQTLLVMEKADLSEFLTDARDRRFAEALSMVPARLGELPGEVGAEREPIDGITMLLSLMARQELIAVTCNAGNPADGMFGYGVVMSAHAKDQADADGMHARLKGMMHGAHLPPPPPGPARFATMEDTMLPGGLGRLSFGPRKAAAGWRYEVVVGSLDNPDPAWANLRAPSIKGLKPLLHGVVDLGGLTNAANLLATFAGRQNPQVLTMVRDAGQAGLYGPNAMKVAFEYGNTESESRGRVVVEGAGKYRDKLGMPEGTLESADFAAVPADAVIAGISKGDLSMFEHLIDQAKEQGAPVDAQLDEFKSRTGVDLRADVLRTLGGTMVYYMSDSTGGGNAGSLVGLMSFKDRAKFMEAHAKLMRTANDLLAQVPDVGRYIRLQSWKEAGVELVSLRMNGMPLPLEITYAATEKWLVAGITPQATLAAAQQVSGKGDKGILSVESIASLAKSQKLSSFSFIDTARMVRPGYPVLSMIGSAVASAVRSPAFTQGAVRDPGMIVPTYRDLAKNVRPSMTLTYWDGDNYVMDTHGDRSALVNVAAGVGTLINVLPAIAVPAGVIGAAAEHHKQHINAPQQGDDAMAPVWSGLNDAALAVRSIPVWSTPEAFGWMLRTDPVMTAAALRAAGVQELGTGMVGAR